jgi:RIO kinase 1
MNTRINPDDYDVFDDSPRSSQKIKVRKRDKIQAMLRPVKITNQAQQVIQQNDSRQTFQFTYQPSRHEEGWLLNSLGFFYEHQWIQDVLHVIKGGKEATVYHCAGGPAVEGKPVAAKVYRPRQFRSLKNDQLYRLGRDVLDENGHPIYDLGMLRAHKKRTTYGEKIRHQSWITYEFRCLKALHEAGADVPKPYEMDTNAILMDYIGEDSFAAPTLNTVRLEHKEAEELFQRAMKNIEIMLAHRFIHGDLSAYNILYWKGKISLIDFPQVVLAEKNPLAYRIFCRDVERVCDYFSSQGMNCDAHVLGDELWLKYGHKIMAHVQPASHENEEARYLKNH